MHNNTITRCIENCIQRKVEFRIRYCKESTLIHVETDIHETELETFNVVAFDEFMKSKNFEYTSSLNEFNNLKIIL